jgi:hypothetical protein
MTDRDGVRFDINRQHPVVAALHKNLDAAQQRQFESMLRVVEQSFPMEALYAKLAEDNRPKAISDNIDKNFRETIVASLDGWSAGKSSKIAFLEGLHLIEPFSSSPDVAQKLAREFLHQK